MPMFPSKPGSSARCRFSNGASRDNSPSVFQPKSRSESRSCPCKSRHSRNRNQFKNFSRHACTCFLCPPSSRKSMKNFQTLSNDRKSLFVSLNQVCARSAASRASNGRSRGSGTDNAAAITNTSGNTLRVFASISMRPIRGSSGIRDSSRPIAVSSASPLRAPSS